MYAPPGFTSVAELWARFVKARRYEMYRIACETYRTEVFLGDSIAGVPDEFGSPKDLAERVFIETVEPLGLTLCSSQGEVVSLPSEVVGGGSDLLARMLVLESTLDHDALSKNDAGRDWLLRMGTEEFEPWPQKLGHGSTWAKAYPVPGPSDDIERLWRSCRYHKLPMWFERHRFAVPARLPPWAQDALDTAFAKTTLPQLLGLSICLSNAKATNWAKDNIQGNAYLQFVGQAPDRAASPGRPAKKGEALAAYESLYPDDDHPSWKETIRAIADTFGLIVSESTLRRALQDRENSRVKNAVKNTGEY